MLAVAGSGMSSMSDASMPFQPAIDEPSNAWPDVTLSSSSADRGTETCCSLPRVSVKRKSMNLTSFSDTIFITSATVLAAIKNLLAGRSLVLGMGGDDIEKAPGGCLENAHRNVAETMPATLSLPVRRTPARRVTRGGENRGSGANAVHSGAPFGTKMVAHGKRYRTNSG